MGARSDFRQYPFQFLSREAQLEVAVFGNGYAAGLLRNDAGQAVALLRDAQRRAMAKAERFGNVGIVGYGQDAAGRLDVLLGDDHGTVV